MGVSRRGTSHKGAAAYGVEGWQSCFTDWLRKTTRTREAHWDYFEKKMYTLTNMLLVLAHLETFSTTLVCRIAEQITPVFYVKLNHFKASYKLKYPLDSKSSNCTMQTIRINTLSSGNS